MGRDNYLQSKEEEKVENRNSEMAVLQPDKNGVKSAELGKHIGKQVYDALKAEMTMG